MIHHRPRPFATQLLAAACFALAGSAYASTTHSAFDDIENSVATDGFNNLTSARITTAQLVAGIPSNSETEGGAILRRTSGGAYPASSGLYQFAGNGSTFEMAVSDAVDGLTSIVFQTYINVNTGSGVYGVLAANNLPRLSFNGGEQFLLSSSQASENLATPISSPVNSSPTTRTTLTTSPSPGTWQALASPCRWTASASPSPPTTTHSRRLSSSTSWWPLRCRNRRLPPCCSAAWR